MNDSSFESASVVINTQVGSNEFSISNIDNVDISMSSRENKI